MLEWVSITLFENSWSELLRTSRRSSQFSIACSSSGRFRPHERHKHVCAGDMPTNYVVHAYYLGSELISSMFCLRRRSEGKHYMSRAAGARRQCSALPSAIFFHIVQACCDNLNISVPRGGREASPHLLVDNQDLVRAFATVSAPVRGANRFQFFKNNSLLMSSHLLLLIRYFTFRQSVVHDSVRQNRISSSIPSIDG